MKINKANSSPIEPVNISGWDKADDPLGAYITRNEGTFAVYSSSATAILLEIYPSPTNRKPIFECWLKQNPLDQIWRAKLKNVPIHSYYAFRCWGPNWPFHPQWKRGGSDAGFICDVDENGNRFNPNKILLDPYAREISHKRGALKEDLTLYQTGWRIIGTKPARNYDTGLIAPKSILIKDATSTGHRPYLPAQKASIYEAHVRGLTQHPSTASLKSILEDIPGFQDVEDIPAQYRGTYKGASLMAPYIKALGFTTIEFLPIHEIKEDLIDDVTRANYWGYMTCGYFAPDRRYAYDKSPGGPTREFKEMIKAFHDQGLEVYLDVVYNHTGEGGNVDRDVNTTAFSSLGGFDCPEYYLQTLDHWLIQEATGCGNQLDFTNEITQQLVLDSLAYWVTEMGIDGFRFDLAPVLGQIPASLENPAVRQFYSNHPLLRQIIELADKYDVEMIAEPWDNATANISNFPYGWGEWNGRFRDAVRSFLNGADNADQFVQMMNGDYDHFADQEGPFRSINFITAHDGFTLMDLVSYNTKNNNQPWPFGPSEGGSDYNLSWDTNQNHTLRRQRMRNFWVILFFSRGIPQMTSGDEFARTQNGNNNPYNIDSPGIWNNYHMIQTNSPNQVYSGCPDRPYHDNFGTASSNPEINPLFRFAVYIANLRKSHHALNQPDWGNFEGEEADVLTYHFRAKDGINPIYPDTKSLTVYIDGAQVNDHDFLVLINMDEKEASFQIPQAEYSKQWLRIVDTQAWFEPQMNCWSLEEADEIREGTFILAPYSIVVLEEIGTELKSSQPKQ